MLVTTRQSLYSKEQRIVRRRDFLGSLSLTVPALLMGYQPPFNGLLAAEPQPRGTHLRTDIAIVGGGVGGCAAAWSAARAGCRVVMTEETQWIGGQLTSQAVPPDENQWIESHGASQSYQRFRTAVRDYYRRHFPLTEVAAADRLLNPGGGMVSRLCHEPRVALAVLYEMLAPYLSNGQVQILLNHRPRTADVDRDRVRSVTCVDAVTGAESTIEAAYVIDATEMGDLLPLTGVEYITGCESQTMTGEPHAPSDAQPANMQAATWCFPIQYVPATDHTIDKPDRYAFWRDYTPRLKPDWSGRLLDWTYSNPITLEPRTLTFDPTSKAAGWWSYRQIVDRDNFQPDTYDGSISLVNWPQNDYLLGNFCEVTEQQLATHREDAKQLSLSLLYWMQTEAPRPDGGTGWRGLRLIPSVVGTADGLAMAPYVRESRRIKAEFTVVEQHVSTAARIAETGESTQQVRAQPFHDSVGIGHYRIDLHPTTQGDNYVDLESLPFQIPLGALLPVRMKNLIAGGKNLGVTHLTNGCYRLHPVEWNIGEAAGALAAHCIQRQQLPTGIRNDPKRLAAFQDRLTQQGVRLQWPT